MKITRYICDVCEKDVEASLVTDKYLVRITGHTNSTHGVPDKEYLNDKHDVCHICCKVITAAIDKTINGIVTDKCVNDDDIFVNIATGSSYRVIDNNACNISHDNDDVRVVVYEQVGRSKLFVTEYYEFLHKFKKKGNVS